MKTVLSARRSVSIGFATLIVMVGGLGSWSVATEITGAIVASGVVEVERNRRVIEHPDGGIVSEVAVFEGSSVKIGDRLILLDDSVLSSDLYLVQTNLYDDQTKSARLEAESDGSDMPSFPQEVVVASRENPEVAALIAGQTKLFLARADTYNQQIAQLRQRRSEIKNQIVGIDAQIAALSSEVDLVKKELATQSGLLERGLGRTATVLSLEREAARLGGSKGALIASRAETRGKITETEIEILRLTTTRRERAIQELRDLTADLKGLGEKRRTLREKIDGLDIRAPVSGVVYGLAVTAPKEVVRPAEPLLYIIPVDRPLVAVVHLAQSDVDEVFHGQKARLRFPALSGRFTRDVRGTVSSISADVFRDPVTGRPYYRVEIVVPEQEWARLGPQSIVPGMQVEAYMKTGAHTPLSYLLKPFTEYFTRAFRET